MSFEFLSSSPTIVGLFIGFLIGLTGVGGGSLMTPFLVVGMGLPAPTAIGTDMVYATVTKLTGSLQHYRQRSINLELAVFLGLGSIPASLLGVGTLEWIKRSYDEEMVRSIMITVIAVTLVIVGLSLIYRNFFMPDRGENDAIGSGGWDGEVPDEREEAYLHDPLGAFGGYLVGLTSIGSGSVMAVILLLLYPIAPSVVVGTDIAHATVLSLVTGLAHITQGNVDFGLVGSLLLGGIPGVLAGSLVAPWLPGKPLKVILAVMLIFVGTRLLFS